MLVEQAQDAGQTGLRTEITRRQRRRRALARGKHVRLIVHVETQTNSNLSVIGPCLRRELLARSNRLYRLANLRLCPVDARLPASLVGGARASCDRLAADGLRMDQRGHTEIHG